MCLLLKSSLFSPRRPPWENVRPTQVEEWGNPFRTASSVRLSPSFNQSLQIFSNYSWTSCSAIPRPFVTFKLDLTSIIYRVHYLGHLHHHDFVDHFDVFDHVGVLHHQKMSTNIVSSCPVVMPTTLVTMTSTTMLTCWPQPSCWPRLPCWHALIMKLVLLISVDSPESRLGKPPPGLFSRSM